MIIQYKFLKNIQPISIFLFLVLKLSKFYIIKQDFTVE